MSNENNNNLNKKVRELYDIIQAKKSQIAKLERPNYKTNLSFITDEFDNTKRINLQVTNDIPTLLIILSKLTNLKETFDKLAIELGLKIDFVYGNYSYEDWKSDIISIINKVNIKKEKDDLAIKEAKLNTLISPEEKRRLEIEQLTKELE